MEQNSTFKKVEQNSFAELFLKSGFWHLLKKKIEILFIMYSKVNHNNNNLSLNTKMPPLFPNKHGYRATQLDISGSGLSEFPADIHLYTKLTHLNISKNNFTSLKGCPAQILYLTCSNNPIESLEFCPPNLLGLACDNTLIPSLQFCPKTLNNLFCKKCRLTSLAFCPPGVKFLACGQNKITSLAHCPPSVVKLWCEFNHITTIDCVLPHIEWLFCYQNKIVSLDNLPSTITNLSAHNNPLYYTFDPFLPNIRNHIMNLPIVIQ